MSKTTDLKYCTELVVFRNFDDIPFDTIENSYHAEMVYDRFCNIFEDRFIELDIRNLDEDSSLLLLEKTSLSLEQLLKTPDIKIFFNGEICVFLNRGEHIEFRILKKNMNILNCFQMIQNFIRELGVEYQFAKDEKGYINSHKHLCGTGTLISHFVHLPILQYFNKIEVEKYSKVNIDIRKTNSPDANPICSMIKVTTCNTSFEDIEQQSNHLYKYMNEILNAESEAQSELKRNSLLSLQDKVNKAFGVAKYALLLDELEILSLHSFFRTASEFNLLKINPQKIDAIFEKIFANSYFINEFEKACETRSILIKNMLVPLLIEEMEE